MRMKITFVLMFLSFCGIISAQTLTHSYTFDSNLNDGVGTAHATGAGSPTIANGQLVLDSNGDYISFPGADLALGSYSAITMEFVYKATPVGGNDGHWNWSYYFGNSAGASSIRGAFNLWDGFEIVHDINAFNNVRVADTDDGGWHHAVQVITPTQLLVYRDGILLGTKTISGLGVGTAESFFGRGSLAWNDPTWLGLVEEINMYDGAMDAGTVASRSTSYLAVSSSALTNIQASVGSLSPKFATATKNYELLVPAGTSSVDFAVTKFGSGATVVGDGTVAITSLPQTVNIAVTSQDGTTTTTYTVNIVDDSCFTPLYASKTNLVADPTFVNGSSYFGWGSKGVSTTFKYCGLSSGYSSVGTAGCGGSLDIPVGPIAPNKTYRVKAKVYTTANKFNLEFSGDWKLASNVFPTTKTGEWEDMDFLVTTGAAAGTAGQIYFNSCANSAGGTDGYIDNLEVYEVDNDATLSALTTDLGALSPVFAGTQTAYEVIVTPGTTQVTLTATANSSGATVAGAGVVTLVDGAGTANIVVTAESGLTKTYTINITAISSDATLSSIALSAGFLDLTFDGSTTIYNAWLPEGTTSVTPTVTTTYGAATYSGADAVDVSSGSGTSTIVVTAENGTTTKTYTINYFVNSLKHSYTFDGNMDDSVGNVNGVIEGTASTANGALVLDANGDYISFDGAALALNSYEAITMEYFFQDDSGANTQWRWTGYFGGDGGTNAMHTALSHWNTEFRSVVSGATIFHNDVNHNDGKLHYIVTVLTKEKLTVYRDGVLYDQVAAPSGYTIDPTFARLGNGPPAWGADPTWQGKIHEFNIYNGALGADFIAARYAAFKVDNSITFNAIPNKGIADGNFDLTATATSGLAVTYTSSNPAVATISGSTVTIVGGGTTTITASQAGNDTFGAAADVTQTFTVEAPADLVAPVLTLLGDATVTIDAGTAYTDAGATATDDVDGDITANIETVNTVDVNMAGTYTITYNVADNAGNAAEKVTRTVIVTNNWDAPDYKAEVPVDGTAYYVYNLGAKGFLNRGAEWGTHTAVSTMPKANASADFVKWLVTYPASGQIRLGYVRNDVPDGKYVGHDGAWDTYADVAINWGTGTIWLLAETDAANHIMSIQNDQLTGDQYLGYSGYIQATNRGKAYACFTDKAASENTQWKFISQANYELYQAKVLLNRYMTLADAKGGISLTSAIAAYNSDVTADINTAAAEVLTALARTEVSISNGSFETNDFTDWTNDGFQTQNNDPLYSKDGSIHAEKWVAGPGVLPAASLSRTLTGLENGIYELVLSGHAVQQSGANPLHTGAYVMAGTAKTEISSAGDYVVSNVIVTDGQLNIGYVLEGDIAVNWTSIDNFRLYYYGALYTPDTTAPVISLNGDANVSVNLGNAYTDAGATATDDVDGDLTSSITVGGDTVNTDAAGTYVITYDVVDSKGNIATQVTRTVTVQIVSDNVAPVITLAGDASVTVEAKTTYTDAGATASDDTDGDISSSIVTVNPVNTNIPATYTITYNVKDAAGNPANQVTRTVLVQDTVVPVITLTGNATVTVEAATTYTDAGASASDNVDGNITSKIVKVNPVNINVPGTYTVTYNVADNSGNAAAQVSRTVIVVDTTKPVITLTGSATVSFDKGTAYTDAGATAADSVDGDLTSAIAVVNMVDVNTPGTYTITYNVTDNAGNAAVQVIRTVIVKYPMPEVTAYVLTPTCPGESNGKISVTSDIAEYAYTINIKGGTLDQTVTDVTLNATTGWEIGNLAAGTYEVTISVPVSGFTQTYGVLVNAINAITAKRVGTGKAVSYDVSGSTEYIVTVNGVAKTYNTASIADAKIEIDASLLKSSNTVTIGTKSDCQGVIEDSFILSSAITVYPNPTTDIINIQGVNEGLIQVFNTNGALIIEKDAANAQSINLQGLAAGVYLVKIIQGDNVETSKVILK